MILAVDIQMGQWGTSADAPGPILSRDARPHTGENRLRREITEVETDRDFHALRKSVTSVLR